MAALLGSQSDELQTHERIINMVELDAREFDYIDLDMISGEVRSGVIPAGLLGCGRGKMWRRVV
ncbi:MAG: hypothetical protein M2R45_02274 [Verrucomicrobia subdivision 3 bacterium]|nr:hypothetical protein [Limisphaerales bacterium]MCS1413940.1 hypothetical protein [Limisphaerales bacterium]